MYKKTYREKKQEERERKSEDLVAIIIILIIAIPFLILFERALKIYLNN